jgi:cell shape-determining protein MreC
MKVYVVSLVIGTPSSVHTTKEAAQEAVVKMVGTTTPTLFGPSIKELDLRLDPLPVNEELRILQEENDTLRRDNRRLRSSLDRIGKTWASRLVAASHTATPTKRRSG